MADQVALPVRQQAEQLAASLPPLLAAADRVAMTLVQGGHGRRRVGTGETFWQFRQYQPGDSAHSVDWRRSARSDQLYVREHEWEAAQSVWLWRDGSPSMRYASGKAVPLKRDRADLLLLALASLLIRGGEHVALFGADRAATGGRATLNRLAAHLTGVGARLPEHSLPALERLPRFCHLVLFGDFLSPMPDIEERLRRYAAQGVQGHLVQVLDPAEEDLPFHGRTEFDGLEDDGRYLASRVETLRDAYHRRMAARRETLQTLARQIGWSATFHRTDRSPQAALLAIYGAVAGDTG